MVLYMYLRTIMRSKYRIVNRVIKMLGERNRLLNLGIVFNKWIVSSLLLFKQDRKRKVYFKITHTIAWGVLTKN